MQEGAWGQSEESCDVNLLLDFFFGPLKSIQHTKCDVADIITGVESSTRPHDVFEFLRGLLVAEENLGSLLIRTAPLLELLHEDFAHNNVVVVLKQHTEYHSHAILHSGHVDGLVLTVIDDGRLLSTRTSSLAERIVQ